MTLTLAEIEAWDDAAIDQVFAAASSRAEGAQTTGDTVGDLLTFVKWHGATAEAARDSASRIKLTLSDHADQCNQVAAAARKATAEVADLKYRLSTIKADAAEAFLSIDEQTGTLTRKTAVLTASQLDHQKAVMHTWRAASTSCLPTPTGSTGIWPSRSKPRMEPAQPPVAPDPGWRCRICPIRQQFGVAGRCQEVVGRLEPAAADRLHR